MNPENRDNRQILAFGAEGQEKIKRTKAGIVGVGGLGSHLVQQLSYLGVRDFVLVDPDDVSTVNLNRIVCSTPSDVGVKKVDVARRTILSVAGQETTSISAFACDLRIGGALNALSGCNVLFGCVDRDGARLILNELAVTARIPYFDLAFGINPEGGKIAEAGGRVALVMPGGPCMLCYGDIDSNEAGYDLASGSEKAFARERGYVAGFDIPQPSVVSLDGIVASVAATEFLALKTGFREPMLYSCYYMLDGELRQIHSRPVGTCAHHLYEGSSLEDLMRRYCVQPENPVSQ